MALKRFRVKSRICSQLSGLGRAMWLIGSLALCGLQTSCSTESFSEYDRTKAAFYENIGGYVSDAQMWRTAVKLNVKVKSDRAVTVRAYITKNGVNYLADRTTIDANGNGMLTVPQGFDRTVTLTAYNGKKMLEQTLTLDGSGAKSVVFDYASLS